MHLAFSRDGRRLAAWTGADTTASPGEVFVWDLSRAGSRALRLTGAPGTPAMPSRNSSCAAFSPDGSRIAIAGLRGVDRDECQVKLWDVRSGQEVLSRVHSGGGPTGLAFAADGRRLLAALALAPDDADLLATRGLARLRLGALAAARDDLARSVQADADATDSWGLLAVAEARLGHHPDAYAALGRMTLLKAGGALYPARPMPADLEREASNLILDASFPGDPFAR
jgi:hypothetical protein